MKLLYDAGGWREGDVAQKARALRGGNYTL